MVLGMNRRGYHPSQPHVPVQSITPSCYGTKPQSISLGSSCFTRRYWRNRRYFLFLRLIICLNWAGVSWCVWVFCYFCYFCYYRTDQHQNPKHKNNSTHHMPKHATCVQKLDDSQVLCFTPDIAFHDVLHRLGIRGILGCGSFIYLRYNTTKQNKTKTKTNDPSAGSPTETLLRLLLHLDENPHT